MPNKLWLEQIILPRLSRLLCKIVMDEATLCYLDGIHKLGL
jgi:hypothetical protein